MDIIEQVYYGCLESNEQIAAKTPEYKAMMIGIEECAEKIREHLDDEGKKLFKRYEEACGGLAVMEERESFKRGWSLCAKLMIDTLAEAKNNFPDAFEKD